MKSRSVKGFEAIQVGRFSSDVQELGTSQERQQRSFDSLVRQHELKPSSLAIFDKGKSGFKGDHLHAERAQFGKFLAQIRTGNVTGKGKVLCWEAVDRFTRMGGFKSNDLLRELLQAGFTLAFAQEGMIVDSDSIDDQWVILQIHIDAASKFSKRLSWRLQEAWVSKRANGSKHSTKHNRQSKACPRWISVNEQGQYQLNEFAATMKDVCQMSIDGAGFKKIRAKYPELSEAIKRTFHERTLVGEWQPKKRSKSREQAGQSHKVYPALLTEAQFQALQVAIARRTNHEGKPSGGRNPASNLFRDILFAGNVPMFVVWTHAKRKAGTIKSKWLQRNNRTGGYLDYNVFENDLLSNVFLNLDANDLAPQSNKGKLDLADLDARLVRMEQEIEQLANDMDNDTDAGDVLATKRLLASRERLKAEYVEKRDQKRTELAQCSDTCLESAKGLIEALAGLAGDELTNTRMRLKGLIAGLVKRIEVSFSSPTAFTYSIEFANGSKANFDKTSKSKFGTVTVATQIEGVLV